MRKPSKGIVSWPEDERPRERLNEWLKKEGIDAIYQLNFLSPKDYNKFFIKLRKDEAAGFRSELDIALRKSAVGDD